ncbi:hypothetical protein [Conexibacter woesei]|uniref:Uncharacterized protein n=1 Tax=Conexibacter woesei (strain DSM 14684 / CCUG 47730 / CIP 108061 / JCM 11494 / NBRC 100937 / ID131577) TaxID=469383 RepID=D3F469_CONWI|nr:hypothetical protein [Conexibacter woesei]ADB50441.1 hypothetical protein Cwoe_2015 [Conexibacter woesei DSM 14684]
MTALNVSPEAIRHELRRLGFEEHETEGRAGVTWIHPENVEGPAVLVPRENDRDLRGYDETLASAVQRLSWITEQPFDIVVRQLAGRANRLELRIVHELTARHSLRALDAPKVVKGFVDLIKNGARTHFTGARVDHRGWGGADYDAALEGIELLAPAPGSFRLIAVSVELPQLALPSGNAPIKSRDALAATLTTLAALSQEERSVEDLGEVDVEALVDAGVSRQLLGAVEELAITDTSGLQLEFSGSWDPTLVPPDVPRDPIVLGDAEIGFARALKPLLRPYEPTDEYKLTGWVETTKAEGLSFEGFPSGMVVVREKVAGRVRDIVVQLGSDDFPAVQAGVSEVRMRGTLERVAGRWRLADPRDVVISRATPPAA